MFACIPCTYQVPLSEYLCSDTKVKTMLGSHQTILYVHDRRHLTIVQLHQSTRRSAPLILPACTPRPVIGLREAHIEWINICDVRGLSREELEKLWIHLIYCSHAPVYYYKELDVVMYEANVYRVDTLQTIESILRGRRTSMRFTYYPAEGAIGDAVDINAFYHGDLVTVLWRVGYLELARRVFPNVTIAQ